MISGSVADRDGRVQKGDRVISINGKSLKGVTHREALSILKVFILFVILIFQSNFHYFIHASLYIKKRTFKNAR